MTAQEDFFFCKSKLYWVTLGIFFSYVEILHSRKPVLSLKISKTPWKMTDLQTAERNIILILLVQVERTPAGPTMLHVLTLPHLPNPISHSCGQASLLMVSPISNELYNLWAFSCVGLQPGMFPFSLSQSKPHISILSFPHPGSCLRHLQLSYTILSSE